MPTFSVIIPTHNRCEMVQRALQSILGQGFRDFEVIVVDDGSTDDTSLRLAAAFHDPRVRVLTQERSGATAARNRGVAHAKGDWLVFLDSDDELAADGLRAFRTAIAGAQCGVVCAAAEILGPNGQVEYVKRPRELGPSYNNHRGLFLAGTFTVRRDIFETLGGFSAECDASQHKEFALRLVPYCDAQAYDILAIDAATVRVHQHGGEHLRDNMENLLNGSLYILGNHERQIRKSARHFADWCSITGVYAAKLGRFGVARQLLFDAVRSYPWKAANFARLLLACCPSLARRVWRRPDER